MKLKFVVEVEVERISGKFAGKDEVAAEIEQWLSDADYGQVSGVGADGDSEYETIAFDVSWEEGSERGRG